MISMNWARAATLHLADSLRTDRVVPDYRDGDDWRIEIKYVLPNRLVEDARTQLRAHRAGFRKAYERRIVNNIYFDTEDLFAARMNDSGVGKRSKVRLRWYGDPDIVRDPVLEVKIKSGGYGTKRRQHVARTYDLGIISWHELTRDLRANLDDEFVQFFDGSYRPTLINSYARDYYESAASPIRATIDMDVHSVAQRLRIRPATVTGEPESELVIIELKASMSDEGALRKIASQLGWRLSRNSKYVRGISAHGL